MRCPLLIDFAKEVYMIRFKERPNYDKMKFLLIKEMLKIDMIPSNIFDWNNRKREEKK